MEEMAERLERRGMVRSRVLIYSRWGKKGDILQLPLANLFSLLREPEQAFYTRHGAKSEHIYELEKALIRLEDKINIIFGYLIRERVAELLEGPFPGDISGLGIKFGTKRTPPESGELINVEVFLDGAPPVLFNAEMGVQRVETDRDGLHYIAGRFTSIATAAREQIVKFVFQCKREEIRAMRDTG